MLINDIVSFEQLGPGLHLVLLSGGIISHAAAQVISINTKLNP